MKKFEEELNNGLVSIGQNIITKEYAYGKCALINYFKDWVSPEDHQAEIDKRKQQYEEHQEIYSKTAKKLNETELELSQLKPQLEKQQPEIPEFVAEYIERCKRSDCGLIWAVRPDRDANENSEKIYDWLYPNGVRLSDGTFPEPFEPDNLVRPDKENHIKFVRAWLDGYTVEVPKTIVTPCPVCGYEDVKSNFCSICGRKNDYE